MVGLISAYIEHFTYVGLFVILMLCGLGLPMPEDVALLAGGFLAHQGHHALPDHAGGRVGGRDWATTRSTSSGAEWDSNLLAYLGLKKSKRHGDGSSNNLERLHAFMHRHGHLAIFYG